ncbi:MAG: alpha/beta fold hydrolase [Gammaproteobacteria bacterium]|nr:alpha/beta fold hydrolase [Gammaproteobacteria bacterium]
MKDLTFMSHGVRCAAWHIPAKSNALVNAAGRPCIIMASGFGGTRDTGLLDFAKPFAEAGIDAFVFDYRGFGASEGTLRQNVSYMHQREDYIAAIDAVRKLQDVDPNRIALWGTSYSGGHIVAVAAQDPRIAAVVSMTPAMDGLAALLQIRRYAGMSPLIRAVAHGLRDLGCKLTGHTPHLIPIVGQPGSTAMISTPGAEAGYIAVSGETWRNEVCARTALEVVYNRPITFATRIKCPMLVQVGTHDQVAPPNSARQTAKLAGAYAQLIEYPVDHFDVYAGQWQQTLLNDQIIFLTKNLKPKAK